MQDNNSQRPNPDPAGNPYGGQAGIGPEQMPPHAPYWGAPPPETMPYHGYPYHPGYMPPPYPGYPPHQAAAQTPPPSPEQVALQATLNDMADKSGLGMLKGLFKMDDSEFWKGALVGAAAVLIMTNDGLRESLLNGASKTAEAVKSSFNGDGGSVEQPDAESDD